MEDKKSKIIRKEILTWMILITFAVFMANFMRNFVIVNAYVPTGSMMDTILERSRIVVFRLSYLFSDPQRFDVIVFESPNTAGKLYVKRIIGVPGDLLLIQNGLIYVNGKRIYEDFVKYAPDGFHSGDFGPVYVPDYSFFVLGDNRNDSDDSRFWQDPFIQQGAILGKVVFSYFPSIRAIR